MGRGDVQPLSYNGTVEAIRNIDLISLRDTLVSLVAAFICGALIGAERQYRQRTAGLRTNVLVAIAAAIFVDMANRLGGREGALHVVAYVVSGVGFLGAGVIMRGEGSVRGLNTAATLWGSAAVGACAGADLILEAALGTVFVLAANTTLRPVVNRMNRQPLDHAGVEVTNTVWIIAERARHKEALLQLKQALEGSGYPARDVQSHAFGTDEVEIEATLLATSVVREELDLVVGELAVQPMIHQAFWSPSSTES